MKSLILLLKNPVVIVLFLVAVAGLAAVPSYYFYTKYQKSQLLLNNPSEAAKQQIRDLVGRVGQLMELPKEEPTVATIADKDKLKDQPFFAKAENGDKVLIYAQAKKAILYRPGINKIIEVSTLNLGPDQASGNAATGSAQTNPAVRVAIYNGTPTVGLTTTAEKQLTGKIANLNVVAKENAGKNNYDKTIVVVLTQSKTPEARAIAESFGAQITSLPAGEAKPEADILIILGSDYGKK